MYRLQYRRPTPKWFWWAALAAWLIAMGIATYIRVTLDRDLYAYFNTACVVVFGNLRLYLRMRR